MNCPHCSSPTATKLSAKTLLGYDRFRCSVCKRKFNERTGTPFNFLEFPTDIVLLVVLWRLRYKLSLRDLAEMSWSAVSNSPTRQCATGKCVSRR
jgi:putative transposase